MYGMTKAFRRFCTLYNMKLLLNFTEKKLIIDSFWLVGGLWYIAVLTFISLETCNNVYRVCLCFIDELYLASLCTTGDWIFTRLFRSEQNMNPRQSCLQALDQYTELLIAFKLNLVHQCA